MRNFILSSLFLLSLTISAVAQEQASVYQLSNVVENKATPVKDQASTGTCWCFATVSFLESELIRTGKGVFDLSEMFIVRHNYYNRLKDNYLRNGKGNIGQGSIAHMATKVWAEYGIVPNEAYTGINYDSPRHSHGELTSYMRGIVEAGLKIKKRSPEYFELQDALFDIYLGKLPETFTYEGKEYTPKSFADYLGLNMCEYIELTSFTHHPFYERVPLEIPDNWDNELLYNIPLDELMSTIDNALNHGFTVAWDGDVSEKGYMYGGGIPCVIPENQNLERTDVAKAEALIPEINVTQELRQEWFETFKTTDDHLEHITGIAKDQNGAKYYYVKNSWGTNSIYGGYHYMSENFVKGKTVSILVHKDAIPKDICKKLGIK